MTTTKQSTANPCAYFKGYSVCRTGPDKWPIFCRQHFQAHFLFENGFILAENCFNSFLRNKPIFWTTEGKRNHGAKGIKVNHHMMTSSNGNIFRVTGPLWGNSPVIGEFSSQRPVTRSFDVFLDLRLNKRLSKQSWDWWFETPSGSLWRHCNEKKMPEKVVPSNAWN